MPFSGPVRPLAHPPHERLERIGVAKFIPALQPDESAAADDRQPLPIVGSGRPLQAECALRRSLGTTSAPAPTSQPMDPQAEMGTIRVHLLRRETGPAPRAPLPRQTSERTE